MSLFPLKSNLCPNALLSPQASGDLVLLYQLLFFRLCPKGILKYLHTFRFHESFSSVLGTPSATAFSFLPWLQRGASRKLIIYWPHPLLHLPCIPQSTIKLCPYHSTKLEGLLSDCLKSYELSCHLYFQISKLQFLLQLHNFGCTAGTSNSACAELYLPSVPRPYSPSHALYLREWYHHSRSGQKQNLPMILNPLPHHPQSLSMTS